MPLISAVILNEAKNLLLLTEGQAPNLNIGVRPNGTPANSRSCSTAGANRFFASLRMTLDSYPANSE
jgi:hypothetical protein